MYIYNKVKAAAIVVLASLAISASAQKKVTPILGTGIMKSKSTSLVRAPKFKGLDTDKQSGNHHFFAPTKKQRRAEGDGVATIVDEDFSLITKGTIDEQNKADFLSGYYVADEEGNYGTYWVYDGLMHQEGWSSLACLQAGGAVGMTYPGYGGCLNTPFGDYSGELTITYRVHIPAAKQKAGDSHLMFCNILKGGVDYPESAMDYYSSVFMKKYSSANLDEDGWIYDTIRVVNTYGGQDCFVQFNAQYDYIVLDDVKITAADTYVAAPSDFTFTDFKRDGFTVSWNKITKATSYTLDLLEQYTEGEGGSFEYNLDKHMTSAQDTVYVNCNGGQLDSLYVEYRVVDGIDNTNQLSFEFYDGIKWNEVSYLYPSFEEWREIDLNFEVSAYGPFYAMRIVSGYDHFDGDIEFGKVRYTAGAPTYSRSVMSDLAVNDTTYTFTGLNPQSDYFVRATSINANKDLVSQPSEYNLAFGISQPVTLPATDVDERGGYTANWEETPKATYYEVDNLAIQTIAEDTPGYTIIDEDFDGATEAAELWNMATISLDDYTNTPGWLGYLNQVDNSAVGGLYYYGMIGGTIATPEICLNNNDGTCNITVTAKGNDGDYLIVMNKAGWWNAMPLSSNYQTATMQLDHCADLDQITFQSYDLFDFMIDKVTIRQDLKAGDILLTQCDIEYLDGQENTSFRFSGLDTDLSDTYAYDVYAYYTHGGSTCYSEKSQRIIVKLDGTDGIKNLNVNPDLNGNVMYNIAGQRVNEGFRGVVIENGKKVIK